MPELIYKITNTVNDLLYVGMTNNLKKRWAQHKADAKRGAETPLHCDMREYGIENFYPEILEDNLAYAIAKDRETYWIRILNTSDPDGYNLHIESLMNTEIAVVKYDAWNWTLSEYAQFFGISEATIQKIRYGSTRSHVTRDHLPQGQKYEFCPNFKTRY